MRSIDTLGALIAGFFDEPCRIAREVAAQAPNAGGSTVIGTRMKTTPDMAAFANATTARYAELNDFYHGPGTTGHVSDVLMPILAVAENAQVRRRSDDMGGSSNSGLYARMAAGFPPARE